MSPPATQVLLSFGLCCQQRRIKKKVISRCRRRSPPPLIFVVAFDQEEGGRRRRRKERAIYPKQRMMQLGTWKWSRGNLAGKFSEVMAWDSQTLARESVNE
ncbi:unnamed protein product [Linum trigynum]|uniref:Uncharacterized protein n=1 Tax=Linum trigynum TaxID=586398 RepID=A0AAV2GHM7_9ROSI